MDKDLLNKYNIDPVTAVKDLFGLELCPIQKVLFLILWNNEFKMEFESKIIDLNK